ncbi:response regulator [Marinobacterium sp. D7]|uniref:hybrid sensor histidine kinase/response regulator n=1 Tax=Marinobacterium ramblicola TaxID=2849041 RepID=UPI001C2CED33|nr:hybrid sensor histidine kinase/response regulator [Marinobacterium ramblicola]MBV1787362.1 response regulator [Marinobacterium ramblicola]
MQAKPITRKNPGPALLSLILLFTPGTHLQAETPDTRQPPVFHHLTIDDGLSHNSVFDVVQDRQGFIWATTVQGINKYDGMSIRTLTPQAPGSEGSTPQFYQTLLEDRDGILWFCNYGAGLVRHDPVLDTWRYYRHDPNNPNSLANDTTWYAFQDRDGIFWVSTFGGLSRFDPVTETFTNYRHDPKDPDSLAFDTLSQITQDADGMLWIGTYGGGLDRLDPDTGVFTHFRHDPNAPGSISDNNVETVWIDPDGSLWVGTDNGLNHLDPTTGRFVRYFHDENDDTSLSHNLVIRIMRDSRGELWISTWGGGLNRFDEEKQRFIRYQSGPSNPDSLSADIAPYFSEDRTGALWFGTFGGIDRYDPAGQRFTRFQHLPDNPNSLPAGRVRAITQDSEGIFWIGMWDQGLVRFDRKTNRYTRYRADAGNPDSLSNNNIFDIRYDPRGWLWVATTAGLNRFDLSSETWTQYHVEEGNPNALAADWVSGVAVDAQGVLWLAVYGAGLQRFDPTTGTFTLYSHDPDNPDSIANDNLNYVFVAADGRLWVGGDASISRFDPATGKAENFTPERHGLSGLTSDQTYQDRQGRIWVATYSGVNLYDPDSNRFTPYPDIRAVLADDAQGKLWVIAGKSLARFDPADGSLRRYDEHDGLLSNALEPTAGYRTSDGEIFVGGAKGFNSFFPDRLPDNPNPPPVVLTAFELRNKPVPVGGDSPLQQHINVTKAITLPHDYTALSLEFAALDYRAPQKNRYAYKLEGFDPDWVYTDSRNRLATYTNLDPGNYTFHVKASNNDGVWNEEGARLDIRITPPWWATWWFRGTSAASLLALLFAAYRSRVRSIQQRSLMLERQVAERTHELAESNRQLQLAKEGAEKSQRAAEIANQAKSIFLANMSHELRTPLNAILGFSNLMQQDPLMPATQQQNLGIINNSGEHLLTLINDILDMAKIEAGQIKLEHTPFDLGAMVRDVTDMMQLRAEEKNLILNIDQTSLFPRYIVGDEARLRQILVNLVGNALKFTDQGGVTIRLGTKENSRTHLLIEVEDSGCGITPQEQQHIFDPFVQVGEQTGSKGTGLGLTITRQFVQMMGGHIDLQSEPGKGSLFRIDLPLSKAKAEDIVKSQQTDAGRVIGLAPGQPEYRVLIVEDQRDNQLLLSQLLESVGFQVRIAENGRQGVELFQAWQPHFIWMDRRMPVMDGMEATRHIRELPGGREVKIVALTASAFREQRDEMLAGGMDDYLRKPFRASEIYDCLEKLLGVEYIRETSSETEEENEALTPEMLDSLPQALRDNLIEALESLEIERIETAIQCVSAHDPALQKKLGRIARNFDYQAILHAFSKR